MHPAKGEKVAGAAKPAGVVKIRALSNYNQQLHLSHGRLPIAWLLPLGQRHKRALQPSPSTAMAAA